MKKYLGIIKVYEDYMSGTNIKIISKMYDDVKFLNMWFDLYPGSEHIILENTEQLNSMFLIFEDMTPITDDEKEQREKTKTLYKKLLKD